MTEELPGEDVARVAVVLDDACAQTTRYKRYQRGRELITGGREIDDLDDLDDDLDINDISDTVTGQPSSTNPLSLAERAAWAALRLEPTITVTDNREHIEMVPHFRVTGSTDPVAVDKTDGDVVTSWVALASAVETPAARARLHHLLFQRGGPNRVAHAKDAIDGYLAVAQTDTRPADRVEAARAAVRLSRAIKDAMRTNSAITELESSAKVALEGPRPSAGAALSALETLTREKAPSAHNLVELACRRPSTSPAGLRFWRMRLKMASNSDARTSVWREIVHQNVADAEASTSEIVRASRLRHALALAEESGVKEVRDAVAVLVQGIRHRDLEMMRIQASTHRFEDEYEAAVAAVLDDAEVIDAEPPPVDEDGEVPAWVRRLLGFINFAPPTGDPDDSREQVKSQHKAAPLQSLFPMALQTPEGLPLYAPSTAADRFDLDMVKWECELLSQWSPIMGEALRRIALPEVPPLASLTQIIARSPAADDRTAQQLAEGFVRYWTGDTVGSMYSSIPMIESMVRRAVLETDRGIFRLQKNQAPGQYVGLGALLDHFGEAYPVTDREKRFFRALLTHPGGWNLRNELAHGYLSGLGGVASAVVLYAAMRIVLIVERGPRTPTDESTEPVLGDGSDAA